MRRDCWWQSARVRPRRLAHRRADDAVRAELAHRRDLRPPRSVVARLEIRRLLINIPPRHMKCLTVSVMWPAWLWTTRPHLKFLTGSYGSNLAHRDTVKSRDIIGSAWYQAALATRPAQSRREPVTGYENTATGKRIATSRRRPARHRRGRRRPDPRRPTQSRRGRRQTRSVRR